MRAVSPNTKKSRTTISMSTMDEMIRHSILEGDRLHKLLVLLSYAGGGEPVRGKTKIQKLVFMLSQLYIGDEEIGFEPSMYGPYSEIVDGERIYLEGLGVLYGGDMMGITEAGRKVAETLAVQESDMFKTIERYKSMFNDMSTNEVDAYVYATYPHMAKNSKISEKIKSEMETHVMSMLRKQKITSGKAADMLDKSRDYVIKKAAQNGIPVLESGPP